MEKTQTKPPGFWHSLLIMIVVFSVIMVPALMWGARINALFLIAWIVAIIMLISAGFTYKELQDGMVKNCTKAIVPMMIVLCVGALVGTWNAAGTVPAIISFGVRGISPEYFPLTAFLLCAVTSLVTGTSWGTYGTAGLALAGIGMSLNIDPVLTAGAVCSGALFGDTISPLSDSPNIGAAVSGVDLFKGLRHQAKVTIPSALICAVIFLFIGMQYEGGSTNTTLISDIITSIDANFDIGIAALLPIILVIVLLALKVPSIPAILSGAIIGGIVACVFQGHTFSEIITYFWGGYKIDSGVEFVDKLLNRGGVTSMTGTAVMFLFAFGLFGMLNAAGIVYTVVDPITKRLRSKLSIIIATIVMSNFGTLVGASMNFAYAFSGSIMVKIFESRGVQRLSLFRALGVGCTAMTNLVPWSLGSIVAIQFLNVSPMELVPYNFFLMVSPVVLIIWTLVGRDTKMVSELSSEEQAEEAETAV